MPLFDSAEGTPLIELAEAGVLSILSLGRLTEDLRIGTYDGRRPQTLKADRMISSQIRRRLALKAETPATVETLGSELQKHVPRTILAIDEAQILMPARSNSTARQALDSFVLEGRNYGLSLWLATQRPKGAISEAAASQIDTFIVHRLSVSEDIAAVVGLLQNARPDKVRLAGRELDLAELIRSLDVGQAIFWSATSDAARLIVGNVRPRNVAHGARRSDVRSALDEISRFLPASGLSQSVGDGARRPTSERHERGLVRRLEKPLFDAAPAYRNCGSRVQPLVVWYPRKTPSGRVIAHPEVAEALLVFNEEESTLYGITTIQPTRFSIGVAMSGFLAEATRSRNAR
ncbi:MAG: ATP-binding protein [Betaproteobacteria bacterium]|nr:ATP-binding protein [Betaproteobacteria bacterium]